MELCTRGALMLLTTAAAFLAFSLMTIAVGTDYWLYSPGVCRSKTWIHDNETVHKNEEVMTHSGLWRTCCLEGVFRGVCKHIDHFLEDADYEQDAAEYLLMQGYCLCPQVGWSFYFGALSFVLAEMVGVLTVHTFIERHRRLRTCGRPSLTKPPLVHSASYYNRYNRYRRRSSYRGNMDSQYSISSAGQLQPRAGPAGSEFTLYTLAPPTNKTADKEGRDGVDVGSGNFLSPLMVTPNNKESSPSNTNRRTTPV
ncbi:hypothetical protein DPEC_G00168550 [Dallia pectoralis]|uniref:Uncharacterized protein n=1 Tax=Dallia pectoralis TaxID=75939 RepID=A0ACC2GCW1_DALPE|nr:hypothetical protein DPEC_G00168550 [Dallia pectoralis]